MNRDIRKFAAWAVENGWTVYDDANGHTRFHDPHGAFVISYPATPGRPRRRRTELEARLRGYGLEIPPPSKGILRARCKRGQ